MMQTNHIETDVINCYYSVDGRTAGWLPVNKNGRSNFRCCEIYNKEIKEMPKPVIPISNTDWEGLWEAKGACGPSIVVIDFISHQVSYVELMLGDESFHLTDELDKFIYLYWNLGLGEVNLNDLISKSEKEISFLSLSPEHPICDLHRRACQMREEGSITVMVRTSALSYLLT